MKTNYGGNDKELLIPVDAEAGHYGHEESSLMQSPELNGNVQSIRYVKFFTLVVVVATLLGSTMYLSSCIRENTASFFIYPKAVPLKTVLPPLTGIFTLNSTLIVLDCLLIVNINFFMSLRLPQSSIWCCAVIFVSHCGMQACTIVFTFFAIDSSYIVIFSVHSIII
jgi:hypothetical protein